MQKQRYYMIMYLITYFRSVIVRKYLMILSLVLVLVLTACGTSQGNDGSVEGNSSEDEVDKEFEKAFGNASEVRNDVTGKWRVVVTSKKFDVEEMLFDYHENFMEEGEVHFIVSFATNTTTVIRDMGGMISSEVHEYVDKEEHDAKTLGSGMILAEYIVNSEGEIEQID